MHGGHYPDLGTNHGSSRPTFPLTGFDHVNDDFHFYGETDSGVMDADIEQAQHLALRSRPLRSRCFSLFSFINPLNEQHQRGLLNTSSSRTPLETRQNRLRRNFSTIARCRTYHSEAEQLACAPCDIETHSEDHTHPLPHLCSRCLEKEA